MTAETAAWIVLAVSGFYLADRLVIWAVTRAWASYRRRYARRSTNQTSSRTNRAAHPD